MPNSRGQLSLSSSRSLSVLIIEDDLVDQKQMERLLRKSSLLISTIRQRPTDRSTGSGRARWRSANDPYPGPYDQRFRGQPQCKTSGPGHPSPGSRRQGKCRCRLGGLVLRCSDRILQGQGIAITTGLDRTDQKNMPRHTELAVSQTSRTGPPRSCHPVDLASGISVLHPQEPRAA